MMHHNGQVIDMNETNLEILKGTYILREDIYLHLDVLKDVVRRYLTLYN